MAVIGGIPLGDAFASDDGGPRRRTRTEWTVDLVLVVVTAGISVGSALLPPDGLPVGSLPYWLDLVGGPAASLLLLAHRRWLVPAVLVMIVLSCAVSTGWAAALALTFLTALRRPPAVTLPLAVMGLLVATAGTVQRMPQPELSAVLRTMLVIGAFQVLCIGCGAILRSRARLLEAMTERAEQAEESARRAERVRIAREMHDVLAHRISLLSMHAGSLLHRRHLTPEENEEGLRVIADSSRRALDDLNSVLRLLRSPTGSMSPSDLEVHPQPTLQDLPRLVESVRRNGVGVQASFAVARPEQVAPLAGRTVYRVAQEALTNAAKHAPGHPVTLAVEDAVPQSVRLIVSNPVSTLVVGAPGSGSGLIGVRERIALVGGAVTACGVEGTVPRRFRLEVVVPCLP